MVSVKLEKKTLELQVDHIQGKMEPQKQLKLITFFQHVNLMVIHKLFFIIERYDNILIL